MHFVVISTDENSRVRFTRPAGTPMPCISQHLPGNELGHFLWHAYRGYDHPFGNQYVRVNCTWSSSSTARDTAHIQRLAVIHRALVEANDHERLFSRNQRYRLRLGHHWRHSKNNRASGKEKDARLNASVFSQCFYGASVASSGAKPARVVRSETASRR